MRRVGESSKEHTAVGRTEIEQQVVVKPKRHRRMVQEVVQPRSPVSLSMWAVIKKKTRFKTVPVI
jgi:hypothetical protein